MSNTRAARATKVEAERSETTSRWPLRMSQKAAKDFAALNDCDRSRVLRCLSGAIRPEQWKKLAGYVRSEVWRVRVVRALRLIVNVQRGVAYVWRIVARKDAYRTADNLDPRLTLTGVPIEEFLMTTAAEGAAAKPARGPGHTR